MEDSLIQVTWLDVFISCGMVVISLGLITAQRIGIQKDITIGAIRSLIQLGLIGYVLVFLFSITSLLLIFCLLILMGLVAAYTAKGRIHKPFPNAIPVLWFSISAGSILVVTFVTVLTMRDPTALTPRYIIPLGGMIFGNSLNGLSLGSERFRSELISQKERIECLLSLGATSERAAADSKRAAFVAAMIPTINSLMVIGLIQIPGIMTGQMLSGVDPLMAARYQIIVLFMLVLGKTLVLTFGLKFIAKQYFTGAHQLRTELL